MHARSRHLRRGSAYVAVLGAATLVMVIALAVITAGRVQGRSVNWGRDIIKARTCAHAGLQWGFYQISQDPDWRTNFPNGRWVSSRAVDDGKFHLDVVDPTDGDLADAPEDPVVLTASGYRGQSRQLAQVSLVAEVVPLEALNTCLHAGGQLNVKGGKSITASGAPLSTNADLDNEGTVVGGVEAVSATRMGVITGTVSIPAPPKHMPYDRTFDTYVALATVAFNPGTMWEELLTPDRNPFGGGLNPDGVYYIDTGGGDLHIKRTRIHGTLVVKCPGKTVFIEDRSLLHAFRSDYPVLVVDGNVKIELKSATENLWESFTRNMNPPGSPYEGHSDTDETDVYPSRVQGLVHVRGNLTIKETSRIVGAVICEGKVEIDHDPTITHEPALYENPPMGYTYVKRMKPSAGTWKQVMP